MKTISLAMPCGVSVLVPAYVRGDWSAHCRPDSFYRWRVTHVPSGYSTRNFADDLTKADAFAIVKLLSRMGLVLPRAVAFTPLETRYLIEAAHAEVLGG